MAKYTSGVLARDPGANACVVFFTEAAIGDVRLDSEGEGLWVHSPRTIYPKAWRVWTWRRRYDLSPPRKGEKFEAEVEL